MPEARPWHGQRYRQVLTGSQVYVKSQVAERYNDLHIRQQPQLSQEVGLTVLDFLTLRFIRRGRTVEHLRDETVVQPQTIVTMYRDGLAGKPMRV
jgi:hypothetical protein